MREILFRGKRIDNGEWVDGDLIASRYISPYQNGELYINGTCVNEKSVDGIVWCQGSLYRISPSTVGQYTGLKDKNGKMIWEGDVIKWDYTCNEGKSHQVRYDVGSACFVASREHNSNIIDTVFYNDGQHAEVIGNIHDNPDLLEK